MDRRVIIIKVCLLVLLATDMAVSQTIFKSLKRNTFYIQPEKRYNWFQAYTECTRRNMTLLSIDSPEKDKEISQLLFNIYEGLTQPAFYIGGQDLGSFRKFVWISSGRPFEYTNWNEDTFYDTNNADDNCVLIGLMGNEKWNVANCKKLYGFICEFKK